MIRVTSIDLEDFKNVGHGRAALSSWKPGEDAPGADVVGIYGQNGSGKTSVIRAFDVVKCALMGWGIAHAARDCVAVGCESARIEFAGTVFDDVTKQPVSQFVYAIVLAESVAGARTGARTGACDGTYVAGESVAWKDLRDEKPAFRTLASYGACSLRGARDARAVNVTGADGATDVGDDGSPSEREYALTPKVAWESICALDNTVRSELIVAQRASRKGAYSLLFSDEFDMFLHRASHVLAKADALTGARASGRGVGKKAARAADEVLRPLEALRRQLKMFAAADLAVVSTVRHAGSAVDALRISTHEGGCATVADAVIDVDIERPQSYKERRLDALKATVANMSPVLAALVPGLRLGVVELGRSLDPDGDIAVQAEITCTRGDATVPLRCESEGIKKLVSILTLLIDVYAKPGACVAIDELDSGVFEFLLGEILQVLQDHGRGQLVFTAHNLRPLEVLGKGSLVFTTTNPQNRYVSFKGARDASNLRNQYLRAINLGGQPETVYEPTSRFDIDGAFYDAAFPEGR